MANDKKLTGICSLRSLYQRLSGQGFLRIHKSYIINTRYITGFYGNILVLEGNKEDKEFLIGASYRKEIKKYIDIIGSKRRL